MEEHEEAIRVMAREEQALLGEWDAPTFEESLEAWRTDATERGSDAVGDILGIEVALLELGMERCEEIFNDAYLRAIGRV